MDISNLIFQKSNADRQGDYCIALYQVLYYQVMTSENRLMIRSHQKYCIWKKDGIELLFYNLISINDGIFDKYFISRIEEKDGQTRVRRSVSAQAVACWAVITLIKDCYKILKLHGKQIFFFTLLGPTGSLNTKVLFKEFKPFAYVYQLLQNFVTGSY